MVADRGRGPVHRAVGGRLDDVAMTEPYADERGRASGAGCLYAVISMCITAIAVVWLLRWGFG